MVIQLFEGRFHLCGQHVVVRTTCHIYVSLLYPLSLSPLLHHTPPTRRTLQQKHRCRLNLQCHLCVPCLSCRHHILSYLTTCILTMNHATALFCPQLLLCCTRNQVPSLSWVPLSPPTHRPHRTTTAEASRQRLGEGRDERWVAWLGSGSR
jgi:hypothetical protein